MSTPPVRTAGGSISVEGALEIILPSVSRRPAEDVPLTEAAGRVLANPVVAAEDLWPFPRAAMDGAAVRAADVAGASPDRPTRLRVIGTVCAGQSAHQVLAGSTAVRVATGAPIPPEADAVIPQELLRSDGEDVLVSHPTAAGTHVFPAGEDARAGERVLEAGVVLHGGHLSLLAALGYGRIPVIRRPAVAIMTCGDELVEPNAALPPGLVRDCNAAALAAEVRTLGAVPRILGIVRDVEGELEAQIRLGLDADMLVTCGGASVGERDLVRPALRREGVAFKFEGLAMKPGAPASFGCRGDRIVFVLPGTPGACRVAFEVLVIPALRAMLGYAEAIRPAVAARLSAPLRIKPGRRRYLWGRAMLGRDGLVVTPQRVQGTAAIRPASEANALIVIDAQNTELPRGSSVDVLLLVRESLPLATDSRPAVLGVVGARGAGKTALIERLIPALTRRGITAAFVKHHAHQQIIDMADTDTSRAAAAGALRTVLAGPGGITVRTLADHDPPLGEVLAHARDVDIVLVEGYRQSGIPAILVCRAGAESDRTPPAKPILAVVGDPRGDSSGRHFAWDAVDALVDFLVDHLRLPALTSPPGRPPASLPPVPR